MPEPIVSRAVIARQADAAAAWAASHPKQPAPPNPYDEHLQPEHFRCWACDFERHLARHMAPEAEGSA